MLDALVIPRMQWMACGALLAYWRDVRIQRVAIHSWLMQMLDLVPWWHPQWLATTAKAGKSAKEHQHQETISIALTTIYGPGGSARTRKLPKLLCKRG